MPYMPFFRAHETYAAWFQRVIYFFLVLADCLNAFAVGAPLAPGLRIFSPDPAAMRARLACMLAYSPGLLATVPSPH